MMLIRPQYTGMSRIRESAVRDPEDLDELEVVCTNCGATISARVAQLGKCPKCGEVPTVGVVPGLDH